ncbi:hypothetical protein MMC25_003987 [Agyrium rufum]|nr:hypothetical protein [Agyrium rufum]
MASESSHNQGIDVDGRSTFAETAVVNSTNNQAPSDETRDLSRIRSRTSTSSSSSSTLGPSTEAAEMSVNENQAIGNVIEKVLSRKDMKRLEAGRGDVGSGRKGSTGKIIEGTAVRTVLVNGKAQEVVYFSARDPGNPHNFSQNKKIWIIFLGILATINSTLDSSLSSGSTAALAESFNIKSEIQLVLPVSLYLTGYVLGPLVFGPLSEHFGRRPIYLSTFSLFTVFTLACALAPNWPAFLFFRLMAGIGASSAIVVTGGLYADVFDDPVQRGRTMAWFMAATSVGPQLGPSISGFASTMSWRWPFWIGLMFAGISFIALLFLPETYAPTILSQRARKIRKQTNNEHIVSARELNPTSLRSLFTVVLTRPIRMFFTEALVFFTCIYLSLVYAIFYLFFVAYPIIFQGVYGMSAGISGLAFLPIILGAFIACAIFLYYDSILQHAKDRHAPWSMVEEYRRLPLACFGAPLFVVSLFWLGWAAKPGVHWIVPMLAGVPFGLAYLLVFMALLNYLTDAYRVYAASAMAASSCTRSVFGALLPLCATKMYQALGIAWASSLLAFLSLAMCVVPFAFLRYGGRIRAASAFCQELEREDREEKEEELEREREMEMEMEKEGGEKGIEAESQA